MYNSDIPTRAELPTTAQLIKSTILAVVAAAVILVTIVLPAEHAIDPTGIGRVLKLTQMGEIREQLGAEAAADRMKDQNSPLAPRSSLIDRIFADLLIGSAHAAERGKSILLAQALTRNDETVIILEPTKGVEWKMTMAQGTLVQYAWSVVGGVVNYDMHGTAKGGKETSYKTARGIASDQGTLTAGFDGTHGWFFRNRGTQPVTITLRTSGAYADLKRVQ